MDSPRDEDFMHPDRMKQFDERVAYIMLKFVYKMILERDDISPMFHEIHNFKKSLIIVDNLLTLFPSSQYNTLQQCAKILLNFLYHEVLSKNFYELPASIVEEGRQHIVNLLEQGKSSVLFDGSTSEVDYYEGLTDQAFFSNNIYRLFGEVNHVHTFLEMAFIFI